MPQQEQTYQSPTTEIPDPRPETARTEPLPASATDVDDRDRVRAHDPDRDVDAADQDHDPDRDFDAADQDRDPDRDFDAAHEPGPGHGDARADDTTVDQDLATDRAVAVDDAAPVDPVATLVPADAADGFRDRWRDVQLRFVDDPRGAATDARQLVDDVVESLTGALQAQRDSLDGWGDGDGAGGDTERLRVAVRHYRNLVDRLLGL